GCATVEELPQSRRDRRKIVGLQRDHDDVDVGDCGKLVGCRHPRFEVASRGQHADTAFTKRVELPASRYQHDLVAATGERRSDVRPDCAAAEDCDPHQSSPKCAGIRCRCTLPVGVRGMLSTRWTTLGTLNGARWCLQCVSTSASESSAAGTTAAATSWPYFTSGIAYATASDTAGCRRSAASISSGEMFSPPRIMISLIRPTRIR